MQRIGRTHRVTAAVAVAALVSLAGCASAGDPGAQEGSTPGPTGSAAGEQALTRFYTQTLQWQRCGDADDETGSQCTTFDVPLDYANPGGETVTLSVLRVPAGDGQATRGALLVNPGGPGGSAVEYASMADWIVSEEIRRTHDIVGFDPRGVGRSQPIECVDDAAFDQITTTDPTPDDPTERTELRGVARTFGQACATKHPQLLGHVSTAEGARDMDILRELLGQPKLNYLGKSYGTFLGAAYAGFFPDRVGRMVLDGAVPPDLTGDELNLGQGAGFETATRAWARSCVASGDCPLGGDVEAVMAGLRGFLTDIDAEPLPVTGDPRVTELTEGWASNGLARAMYQKELWESLTEAMRAAEGGDGTPLFELAKQYADRGDDGEYQGNLMQVISAVNCLDRPGKPVGEAQMDERIADFERQAPTWGRFMAWSSVTCEAWPIPPTGQPQKVAAAGSGPIVVVGTIRDPATPYAWAQRLAGQLENGHLITHDGDGHTAYKMSNACVDKAVDAYLMQGTVPAAGLRC